MQILAPLTGRVLPLEQVPDPVFAGKMLGDGLAIEPTDGLIVSPIAGEVVALFPHAAGIRSADGLEVLVHCGIDSTTLKGVFTSLVAQGAQVTAGYPLIRFDLERLRQEAASPISPVILLQRPDGLRLVVTTATEVTAGGTPLLELVADE